MVYRHHEAAASPFILPLGTLPLSYRVTVIWKFLAGLYVFSSFLWIFSIPQGATQWAWSRRGQKHQCFHAEIRMTGRQNNTSAQELQMTKSEYLSSIEDSWLSEAHLQLMNHLNDFLPLATSVYFTATHFQKQRQLLRSFVTCTTGYLQTGLRNSSTSSNFEFKISILLLCVRQGLIKKDGAQTNKQS